MKTSPTARTKAYCRDRGWLVDVAERWNPHARIRQDLFGFIDLVVLDGAPGGPLAIQATSDNGGNSAGRVAKIYEVCWPQAEAWLQHGGRIEVWAWAKRGARGKRKLWSPRITQITERLTLDETLNGIPI